VPLLLLASGMLFVRAVWFGEGVSLASFRVPPGVAAYGVCPAIWGLCGLFAGLEAFRRRNPQEVLVTSVGVKLPRGRFTADTIAIGWDDLEATLTTANLLGWHVYEITCTDLGSGKSVRISSALFRKLEDFAAFLKIMAKHMGQEWSVAGFWSRTYRGRNS
jgi:hypothetical protein